MITTNAKLAIAGIGLGGATIGGGTYYLVNKNNETDLPRPVNPVNIQAPQSKAISAWLDEDGKVLLATGAGEWTQRWEDFKTAHPKGTPPTGVWAFTDWNAAFAGKGDELKTKCATQGKVEINSKSGNLYEAVKRYCTKDKSPSPTPQ